MIHNLSELAVRRPVKLVAEPDNAVADSLGGQQLERLSGSRAVIRLSLTFEYRGRRGQTVDARI